MSTTSSASVSAASINASDVLAVAALLSHAVETPGLISACMAYQDGVETLLYKDGDVAAGQGHLSLLRLRRALCRKGKGSEGGANGSNNEAGGDDGCSTDASTSTTCRIDAGRNIISTGRRGTCRGSSSVEEEEGGEDEDWNEGGADKEEEVLQLEDLTFSHRAADWAAAQGHLGIVRCAACQPQTVYVLLCSCFGALCCCCRYSAQSMHQSIVEFSAARPSARNKFLTRS